MPSTVTEVEISFPLVKKALPAQMSKREKIDELQRIIHKTRKEKLLQVDEYVKKINKIAKGLRNARKNLENASSKNEITKWRHVCAMWGKEKDVLKEMRYSQKQLDEKEAKLELELMKLKTGA